MSTISDELLNAFLDGELSEPDRSRVAAALASDDVLAARYAQLERLDVSLKSALPGRDTALPAGIVTAIDRLAAAQAARTRTAEPGKVVDLAARRAAPTAAPSPGSPPAQWRRWALAASILVAVGVALVSLDPRRPASPQFALTPAAGATLPAGHPLATTLSESASGTARDWPGPPTAGGTVYPVLSFIDRAGALCREFEVADGQAVSVGVACRRDARWQIEAIATAPGRSAARDAYVPASGTVPAEVSSAIDRLMAGEPLDGAAEAAELAR